MSVSPIVTGGFGSFGSVNLVPTLGFGIGAAPGTSGAFYFTRYVLGAESMPRLVLANTATAAYRRCYFHLVGTDGITAATSEAAGQPQISTNGGAWTNTGIGTLTAIGNGRYYADITQSAVATAGDVIETRYKSASTAECPGDVFQVVAFNPNDAAALGLTNLDAAISTRSTYAGGDTSGTTTLLSRLTSTRAGLLDNIDTTISSRLAPTTAGRTLDVSVGGEAGIDWANIGSPTTSQTFSGTTVGTTTAVTGISSGGITSGSFASGAITAASIAADAIGASELATDAITEIVTGVLTTQMTESYAADGTAPTLAQALFLTMQKVGESTVPGTSASTVTQTVKKLDGSTTAATYTITLNASNQIIGSTRAS